MNLKMDELESAPARKSGRGGFVMLVVGIALGVAGTMLLPRYLEPLLPESIRAGGEQVDGEVLALGRDGDKLLITVDTPKGAVLATFTSRVAEVELLVRVGDTLTLAMDRYDPFVSDPAIAAVRKRPTGSLLKGEASGLDSMPAAVGPEGVEPQADTMESGAAEVESGAAEADTALYGVEEMAEQTP